MTEAEAMDLFRAKYGNVEITKIAKIEDPADGVLHIEFVDPTNSRRTKCVLVGPGVGREGGNFYQYASLVDGKPSFFGHLL